MRTRVKICGITRRVDAVAAINAGADAIGLVFYPPSPRAVTVERAREICTGLPPFVTVTALFVNETAEKISEVVDLLPIDLLQFHGDELPEECRLFGRPYMKALRVRPDMDLFEQAERYTDASALLLDAYRPGVPGGTGETFDWQLIPEGLPRPVVLAGGLDAGNVGRAIAQVSPYGVDVSGGVEAAKGIKDKAQVCAFINEVKCAERV